MFRPNDNNPDLIHHDERRRKQRLVERIWRRGNNRRDNKRPDQHLVLVLHELARLERPDLVDHQHYEWQLEQQRPSE